MGRTSPSSTSANSSPRAMKENQAAARALEANIKRWKEKGWSSSIRLWKTVQDLVSAQIGLSHLRPVMALTPAVLLLTLLHEPAEVKIIVTHMATIHPSYRAGSVLGMKYVVIQCQHSHRNTSWMQGLDVVCPMCRKTRVQVQMDSMWLVLAIGVTICFTKANAEHSISDANFGTHGWSRLTLCLTVRDIGSIPWGCYSSIMLECRRM